MKAEVSSVADVLAALPAVQRSVREDVRARIAAGEAIAATDVASGATSAPVSPFLGKPLPTGRRGKRKSAA